MRINKIVTSSLVTVITLAGLVVPAQANNKRVSREKQNIAILRKTVKNQKGLKTSVQTVKIDKHQTVKQVVIASKYFDIKINTSKTYRVNGEKSKTVYTKKHILNSLDTEKSAYGWLKTYNSKKVAKTYATKLGNVQKELLKIVDNQKNV